METSSLIAKHLFWRGLYFCVVLVMNVLIARFFAAEKSGQIFYIINNLSLILLITGFCLEAGTNYYVSSGSLNAGQMARFCVLWTIPAACFAYWIWKASLNLSPGNFAWNNLPTVYAVFFIAGILLSTYFIALFYSLRDFAFPNKILLIVNIPMIILLLTANQQEWFRRYFLLYYFFSFFLQGIVLSVCFFWKNNRQFKSGLPGIPMLKKIFLFAGSALLANLIYFLVNRIDYWFVEHFCTATELGNYIQASKLTQMLVIIPSISGATLFPIFSSGKTTMQEQTLIRSMRILFWIIGTLCLLVLATGWFLFPLIFGSSFNLLYGLFIFLIPGVLCVTMNYPLSSWYSSRSRINVNIKASLFALLLICILDPILIPKYGVRSAALVSSLAYFCCYGYSLFIFRREFHIGWRELFLLKQTDLRKILRSIADLR